MRLSHLRSIKGERSIKRLIGFRYLKLYSTLCKKGTLIKKKARCGLSFVYLANKYNSV